MNEQRPGPPDLSAGAARIVTAEQAILVPPGPAAVTDIDALTAGVLWPDGRLMAEAVTWRTKAIHSRKPPMPAPEAIAELPGTWLYLGELDDHVGHFLTECLARAWALRYLGEPIVGALYIAGAARNLEQSAAPLLRALPMLGVDVPLRVITEPRRVERLLVPTQGFGLFDLIEGSPQFRAFAWTRIGSGIAPDGPDRLYISRSRLHGGMEGVLAERILEERLAAEGYEIFHPQEHSLERQIAVYRAAREVVGLDGTPFHLLAYVGDNLRRAAVICRSSAGYDTMFARQLRAFLGVEASVLRHLRRIWAPAEEARPQQRRDVWGELDFTTLGRELGELGLIRNLSSWTDLSEAEVAQEVARVEAVRGGALRPAPADPGTMPAVPFAPVGNGA